MVELGHPVTDLNVVDMVAIGVTQVFLLSTFVMFLFKLGLLREQSVVW